MAGRPQEAGRQGRMMRSQTAEGHARGRRRASPRPSTEASRRREEPGETGDGARARGTRRCLGMAKLEAMRGDTARAGARRLRNRSGHGVPTSGGT